MITTENPVIRQRKSVCALPHGLGATLQEKIDKGCQLLRQYVDDHEGRMPSPRLESQNVRRRIPALQLR